MDLLERELDDMGRARKEQGNISIGQLNGLSGGFKFGVQHIANPPLLRKDQGVGTSGGVKGFSAARRGVLGLMPLEISIKFKKTMRTPVASRVALRT